MQSLTPKTIVLKERVHQGKGQAIIDLGRTLQYFQVDLITVAGVGKAWGDLPLNQDRFNYLATVDKLFPHVHSTSMVPWMRYILYSPLYLRFFWARYQCRVARVSLPFAKYFGQFAFINHGFYRALQGEVKERCQVGKSKVQNGDMLVGYDLPSASLRGDWNPS
jgi:hypothetical protein